MSASIKLSDITCPITFDIMVDPVTGVDGGNYERAAIVDWLRTNGTSPLTRRPMYERDLIPNRLLKDMVERYKAIVAAEPAVPLKPFVDADLTVTAIHSGQVLNVAFKPPATGVMQPIAVGLGLDNSGSMAINACETNEGGAFARLDLVKHTARAIVKTLGPSDKLFLVKFSDSATLLLPPTLMTDTGKEHAMAVIEAIVTEGSTNIWHCLQVLNAVSSKPDVSGMNVVTALLTDGLPNVRPPCEDESVAYKGLVRYGNLSTFAFGYDIDSKLMGATAAVGGGGFGFAPDYSIVATVFINWLATVRATASRDHVFSVKYEDGSETKHNTNLIQFGQTRNITFAVLKKPVSVTIDGHAPVAVVEGAFSDYVRARYEYIQALKYCIGHDGDGGGYTGLYAKYAGSADSAKELVRDVKPMGEDDEGQIMMAPRFWAKWGKHYTRAYLRAVELEQCMNFKDPGLQIFGGELFHANQKMGSDVFCNLEPLKPTGRPTVAQNYYGGAAPPVNMGSVFLNQGGGCWGPGSKIKMADGSRMPIEDVRPDMKVWTVEGDALVVCSLVLGTKKKSQGMCKYGDLWISPWHPVYREGRWVFPSSFTPIVDVMMPVLHNLVLSSGHVVDIDGVQTVTLGHELKEDLVAHEFFGSRQAIFKVLERMPGFANGHIVFDDLRVVKDPVTQAITGWYNGPE